MTRNVLPTLLLAFLLGGSILASMPVAAYPVSPAQQAAVKAEFGDGAPYTPWQVRSEVNRFYLSSAPTSTSTPAGALPFSQGTPANASLTALPRDTVLAGYPQGEPITQAEAMAQPQAIDRQTLIGIPFIINTPVTVTNAGAITATFPLGADSMPVDSVTITQVGFSVFAACFNPVRSPYVGPLQPGDLAANPTGIRAELLRQQLDANGNWAIVGTALSNQILHPQGHPHALPGGGNAQTASNLPAVIQRYAATPAIVGDATIGSGVSINPAVDRLAVRLSIPGGTSGATEAACILHYDTSAFPTHVYLVDDGARSAMLIEDVSGEQRRGFPSAGSTSSDNRRFVVRLLQASPWGNTAEQTLRELDGMRIYDQDENRYRYYVENFDEQFAAERDIRDLVDLVSREDLILSPTMVQRTFLFSYSSTLPDTTLVPEYYVRRDAGDSRVILNRQLNRWDASGPAFDVGGKGFTFTLAANETALHRVNPREPTQFVFQILNTGTEDDVISVTASDPGDGWTATVAGGRAFVRPGGRDTVTLTVTPPATALVGASKPIILSASSSFNDVPDAAQLTVNVEIVSAVVRLVDLSSDRSQLEIRPGQSQTFTALVSNRGTARDHFVVTGAVPGTGWSVATNPSSLQVFAGSTAPVQVTVRAPAEAPSGTSLVLALTASEVGNAAVNDRLDLPIVVRIVDGIRAQLLDPTVERQQRDSGSTCEDTSLANEALSDTLPLYWAFCNLGIEDIDPDYDYSHLFRVRLENFGDRESRVLAEAVWEKPAGTDDGNFCDGEPYDQNSGHPPGDGVPDGWRFNYDSDVGGPIEPYGATPYGVGGFGGYSGLYFLNTTANPIVLAPKEVRYVYFELAHNEIGCSDGDAGPFGFEPDGTFRLAVDETYSSIAQLRVNFKSLADPGNVQVVRLLSRITPEGSTINTVAGLYSGAVHAVGLEPALGKSLEGNSRIGQPAVFDLIAINKGNEYDDLILTVDLPPTGWTHQIAQVGSVPSNSIVCDAPTNDGRTMRCPRVGIWDEVHFQVIATPGNAVQLGDLNDIQVSVRSGDASQISESVQLLATATGTYVHRAGVLGSSSASVARGQTAALPFQVENLGTASDTYRFSLVASSPAWRPVFAGGSTATVPAGFRHQDFLGVTAPANATLGVPVEFRVLVESLGNGAKTTIQLFATATAAGNLVLEGVPQDVLITTRGVATNVTVKATQLSGSGAGITFTVDTTRLPAGWTVDRTTATATLAPDSFGKPVASATFKVTAPANALASTKAVFHVSGVTAHSTPLSGATDVALSLASTFGLGLSANSTSLVIAPGGDAVFHVVLKNNGLGTDTVRMTNTAPPSGWTVLFNPPSPVLGPLESRRIEVKVSAPVTATPGNLASIVVFATSTGDSTKIASLSLQAQVGFNALRVVAPLMQVGAPQETLAFVLNLTNTGTLPDEVFLDATVDTAPLAQQAPLNATSRRFQLDPGQSIQVLVTQTFGDALPSATTVQSTIVFTSLLDERTPPARATTSLVAKVLPYASADINGDSLREYAVDRNQDAADGFEEFRPTGTRGGRPLSQPDLTIFLRDEARAALSRDVTLANGTIVRAVVLLIDGDGDGKIDHFLDRDGDNLPDYYWDPDANKASPIEFRKDVNGDQVPELFVDANGDGRLDALYDLTRGTFTKVLQVDVDGDGQLDYVVDRNGNGQADQDETVLYTRTGNLLIVQKVDVDGDGRLDQVFDVDGDGNPDYFVPAGSTKSVEIVLRDVNRDGVADWTFDGDGDGRRESYYDPVTGKAHVIDASGHFLDALGKYWYVGALFVVVLALFVALVLVTRK